MRYRDVHALALRLDVLARDDRGAAAHALRLWRARRAWGGSPTQENWEAIFSAGEKADRWLQEREEAASGSVVANGHAAAERVSA